MLIRFGSEIAITCAAPTSGIAMLQLRPERERLVLIGGRAEASAPLLGFTDCFGNRCVRFEVRAGATLALHIDGIARDSGEPDRVPPRADTDAAPADLPDEALRFLLPSRYCESDLLGDFAWRRFGATPPGWRRVQAVCDFVHARLRFSYAEASATRTAAQALEERVGVCRDFAHLAIALCRALNVPARYCTGYLGDIGVPAAPDPMDFSAWFEAHVAGAWHAFDARHNRPRIGRLPIAHGRDAADVAVVTTFGAHALTRFSVWTEELPVSDLAPRAAAARLLDGVPRERRRILG